MATCNCCGCSLADDYGTSTVEGSGSFDDPYSVTMVDPNFTRPLVRATALSSDTQTISTATPTAVNFATEAFDTDTMWAIGQPSRIVFQTTGIFTFGAEWVWPSSATPGIKSAFWRLNGATQLVSERVDGGASAAMGELRRQLNYVYPFNAGDYVELIVTQTSGGNLVIGNRSAWAMFVGKRNP